MRKQKYSTAVEPRSHTRLTNGCIDYGKSCRVKVYHLSSLPSQSTSLPRAPYVQRGLGTTPSDLFFADSSAQADKKLKIFLDIG